MAAAASVAFAETSMGPSGEVGTTAEVYRTPPSVYPMTSDRYAIQYKFDGGDWTDAKVYISYYGGTNASPVFTYTIVGYTLETSMSFASIPAGANADVQLRATKLWNAPFLAGDRVSARPGAKRTEADLMSDGAVQISTRTGEDFAGEQFIPWWDQTRR
jgi:hypothetical protein